MRKISIAVILLLIVIAGASLEVYRLREARLEAGFARAFHEQRLAEERERESHVYRVRGPVSYFVGKDGETYAWVP